MGNNKLIQFVRECVSEFKKIVWPSKESVVSSVKVVLVSTIVVSIFLAIVDYATGKILLGLLGI